MLLGSGVFVDRITPGDMSRAASGIHVALPRPDGSCWLLSTVLSSVGYWHITHGWRAEADAVRSYTHGAGRSESCSGLPAQAMWGLSIHPAGEHPFGLLRLESVSASADLSQVGIRTGRAKIAWGF